MRLKVLHNGYRPIQKLIMSALFGKKIPGPVAAMSYRREMGGKHLGSFFQEKMRSQTSWGKGEAELFAGFVSSLQKCRF